MNNTPKWNWWLCKTSDMSLITELTSAHGRQLQLMLNQPGTLTCWLHLEDSKTAFIQEHTTCIVCYRNGKAVWSGEIFDCVENVDNEDNATLNITALGWFELLNKRLVHTGREWKEMLLRSAIGPIQESLTEEQLEAAIKLLEEKGLITYKPVATESAQDLYYGSLTEPFGVPNALIINDLIYRANIDVESKITVGEVASTLSVNYNIQQFAYVGEQITKLTAVESGPDFMIDPLTRKFSTYRNEIIGNVNGYGQNRGPGVKFTYPGNCVLVNRNRRGTKTQNRTEVTGQYGVAKYESISSIEENGLFEEVDSSPETTYTGYLAARAAVETLTLEKPFTIITFNPRAVNNLNSISVPRPFEDYGIGDVVYSTVRKGPRLQIGTVTTPQAIRVFGFTVTLDDNGVEKISNIQTTYANE